MICCEQCNAPIDLRIHQVCWNCNVNTHGHSQRSDLRYLLAYSRLSSVVVSVALLILAGLLVWQVAMLATGKTNPADLFSNVAVLLVLLVFGCRIVV